MSWAFYTNTGQIKGAGDPDNKWTVYDNTGRVKTVETEVVLSLSDVTTSNVTSAVHGFAPKSPADATKFLNGAATPAYAQPKDADLVFTDVITNNASTSAHGFLKKLDNTATHYMDGTGVWSTPPAPTYPIYYRKTTSKTVNTTIVDTDLLNGEITLAANDLGTNKRLRLHARGDWKQNVGGNTDIPIISLKLGATTLIKTALAGGNYALGSATRYGWMIDAEIMNLGATNSQWSTLLFVITYNQNSSGASTAFTTGEGVVTALGGTSTALGSNSTAVDTTAGLALVLSVINASANANYETKLFNALVVIE